MQTDSVILQLKQAGYTVRKDKPTKLDSIAEDELLEALGIMLTGNHSNKTFTNW